MPRKRWRTRLSSYDVPDIDPRDRNAVEDADLVRHALVDFDELAVLSSKTREQLVADLVDSIRFARGGVKAGKRGLSDKALAQQIFLSDVRRALEGCGLPAKRWRKRYDDGDRPSVDAPESFFFRLAREIADVSGMALPQDLKLPGKRAVQHQYGIMSPAMKAAQEVELAARRQRLSKLRRPMKSVAP
jgi:hypothetical protein